MSIQLVLNVAFIAIIIGVSSVVIVPALRDAWATIRKPID